MLLNLARLDQHDPTYFLQFGQISVQYQVSGSLNVVGNETIPPVSGTTHPLESPLGTGTATVGAAASTTPSFTFIPVTDDKVAQALLQPVPPEVLYSLFQQGWPVDQLMRLMVQRFEIQLPGQSGVSTFTNSLDDGDVKSYAIFLKMCAIARQLQIHGALKLQAKTEFVPLAQGWALPKDKPPTPEQLIAAQDKDLVYVQDPDTKNWQLGRNELIPIFTLGNGSDAVFASLKKQAVYNYGDSLNNMRTFLGSGFAVQEKLESDTGSADSHLILRSFLNILAAAAKEQTNFEAVLPGNPLIPEVVPDIERQPILKLRWNGNSTPLLSPLLALNYHGQTYQITDPVTAKVDETATWNRDVFRLLTQLAFQVSLDTSKFPLPTTLQVVQ
ncbi:MAG: hypothetical protein LV481_13760 [Methylacidiphilales bacterium]|nr:hypothetical protein [Candidatus Methylacidiphilales bacterium]